MADGGADRERPATPGAAVCRRRSATADELPRRVHEAGRRALGRRDAELAQLGRPSPRQRGCGRDCPGERGALKQLTIGVACQGGRMTADTSFPPTFSIVTLGVSDLERSVAFYRALGWEQHGDASAGITCFLTTGSWIGLFGYDALAEDVGVPATPAGALPAYRGISLAVN